MALEAALLSQAGHFGYYGRVDSPYALPWWDLPGTGAGFGFAGDWDDHGLLASVAPDVDEWDDTASARQDRQSSEASTEGKDAGSEPAAAAAERRKRRRTKVVKNKEEMETQRMTHIAVERNRRRQMNEYLAVLRSLMPPSYAHRGDQASIVGGAINYVRELEQLLQSLQVQSSIKNRAAGCSYSCTDAAGQSPFAGFFTFPQYSTSSHVICGAASSSNNNDTSSAINGDAATSSAESSGAQPAAVADIEVTMAEGHANLKVLALRRPKQLLKLVAGLQQLRLPPLHLNMTSVDAMVLYTFSLKVEDDSKMGSVEDIATAVHEILSSIQRQEEAAVM